MKFRPLHDRVVVRRITPLEKSAGGIIIPDTVKEKPMEGEVIAAGPGARDDHGALVPLAVKDGDRVLFGKWSGTEVKLDGEELLIMKESDLMGVIETPLAQTKAALNNTKGTLACPQKTFASAKMPAAACCAASISWPTP